MSEMMIATLPYAILIMFIFATILGVMKGISNAFREAKGIKRGEPIKSNAWETEKARFESLKYRIMHPLGYLNVKLISKIEDKIKEIQDKRK